MLTTKAECLAAAAAATAALASLKSNTKADIELAFRKSALATCEYVIVAKGKALDLAKANKEAGSGYGSDAAVGFHSLTGLWLSLPIDEDGDWATEDGDEPTAQRVQSLIKKIGQPKAKSILNKKGTNAQRAFASIAEAADALPVDLSKLLKAAAKAVAQVEAARLAGADLPEDAMTAIDSISLALHNVVLGAQPIAIEVVREASPVAV